MLRLNPKNALPRLRADYQKRLGVSPSITQNCDRAQQALRCSGNLKDLLASSAEIYALERRTSVLFVAFDPEDPKIDVCSVSGIFRGKDCSFPGQNPGQLVMKTIAEKHSVHIAFLEKDGMPSRWVGVDLVGDHCFKLSPVTLEEVRKNLPLNLCGIAKGAVLFTPLGLQEADEFDYGFIFEYKADGFFAGDSIREARTYSSLFALETAEKMI